MRTAVDLKSACFGTPRLRDEGGFSSIENKVFQNGIDNQILGRNLHERQGGILTFAVCENECGVSPHQRRQGARKEEKLRRTISNSIN